VGCGRRGWARGVWGETGGGAPLPRSLCNGCPAYPGQLVLSSDNGRWTTGVVGLVDGPGTAASPAGRGASISPARKQDPNG
jgi:hypothetical protein